MNSVFLEPLRMSDDGLETEFWDKDETKSLTLFELVEALILTSPFAVREELTSWLLFCHLYTSNQ